MTDRAEFRRLTLKLERDLTARMQLAALLSAAEATIVACRRDLQNLRSRMARRSRATRRTK
jgi:hypothetical protein